MYLFPPTSAAHSPRKTRTVRTALATVATIALLLPQTPAHATTGNQDVSGGSVAWKMKDSWYDYILAGNNTITPKPAPDGRSQFDPVVGTVDRSSRSANLTAEGSVRYQRWFGNPTGEATIDVTLSALRISYANGSGTITVDATGNAGTVPQGSQADIRLVNLTSARFDTAPNGDTTITFEGIFPAGVGTRITGFTLYEGQAMSPLTVSLPGLVSGTPTATALALTSEPASEAIEGEEVSLRAVVTPHAAGTVAFADGSTDLGRASVIDGTAALRTSALAVGSRSLTATFEPENSGAYRSATARHAGFTVNPSEQNRIDSQITVALGTTAPVLLGSEVSLTARVQPGDTPGNVTFFTTPESTGVRQELTTAPVNSGTASTTVSTLPAGGNTITAEFQPTNTSFTRGSQSDQSARIGIVDLTAGDIPTPGADALPITGASASWAFSKYFANRNIPWQIVEAPLSVTAGTWNLSEGAGLSDGNVAQIRFPGSILSNVWGYTTRYSNPELTVTARGTGFWTAEIATYCSAGTGPVFCAITPPEDIPVTERVVLATFDSAQGLTGPGTHNAARAILAYEGVTGLGTWAREQDAGFHNQFLWRIPALERGYYQASGSAADAEKRPEPVHFDFEWREKTATTLTLAAPGDEPLLGTDPVRLTASVKPAHSAGSVEFYTTSEATGVETSLGTAPVNEGSAVLNTTALVAGGHKIKAVFTPTDQTTTLGATTERSQYLGIVDITQPDPRVLGSDARAISGVSARWDWSEYSVWNPAWQKSASDSISVQGETYALSNGHGTADDHTAIITFPGTMRMSSYASYLNPPFGSWIEVFNPTLTLNRDGSGTWTGTVRSSETTGWTRASAGGGRGENTGGGRSESNSGVRAESAGGGRAESTGRIRTSAQETRVTLLTFSAATGLPANGETGTVEIPFDFAGTVAPGTWQEGFSDAWHSSFIATLPAGIRPFYFNSGLNIDGRKAPLPLTLNLTWPASSITVGPGIPAPGTPGTRSPQDSERPGRDTGSGNPTDRIQREGRPAATHSTDKLTTTGSDPAGTLLIASLLLALIGGSFLRHRRA
ncbi:Ig-like domain repeat protein [Lysinibacter sp. HNR]|uniref:Ig-like domain repeat protein n=1 Tax=Lysinibacter sp. HNR TaxID=3031408 RepID=UPI002435BF57|nr:Ig-like domain repeat protein [Lysinibacter sp. HNR]WGD37246.1 Ig-like domain repeat protein [Lysinibacter sp. HNR]